MQSSHARQSSTDDDADRTNRFLSTHSGTDTPNNLSLRERAASQPPRTSANQGYLTSPPPLTMRTNSGGPGVWPRFSSSLHPNASLQPGLPSSVPTRSSSFSNTSNAQQAFSSAMRESRFASTFEDDESEALSDIHDPSYDERYISNTQSAIGSGIPGRGRTYAGDMTRSRSQSVATTTRPGAIGSPFSSGLWNDAAFSSSSNPLNIPGSRYDSLKPTGSSRYGSLGAIGRSPSNGYSHGSFQDQSNMSPFVRDLQQIMNEDPAGYRDPWLVGRTSDENGGGGSGTTSRRHSVSVIARPRPTVVGFSAPGLDPDEPPALSRPGTYQSSFGSSGGSSLLLTDDDLASDLSMLNLGYKDEGARSPSNSSAIAPSSLPNNALLSRSPAYERLSPYQPLHLNIPGGGSYRHSMGSPSESAFSGGSPSRHQLEGEPHFSGARENIGRPGLTARFVPGQGIQHIPESSVLPTPVTPGGLRPGANYPPGLQRRPSDAAKSINDLGKGVPLHSMPTSWPLYIVEFKAGRTDLFYCTDLSLDIRVGDLVIVEADRGKDLGKVVNDTITLAEVEAFQKQQKILSGYAEAQGQLPTSPTSSVKEINPKMIYGKARGEDTQ